MTEKEYIALDHTNAGINKSPVVVESQLYKLASYNHIYEIGMGYHHNDATELCRQSEAMRDEALLKLSEAEARLLGLASDWRYAKYRT